MQTLRNLIPGVLGLLHLGFATRFRLRGPYWRWRLETALGADRAAWPSRGERFRSILAYGAWARRIRKAAAAPRG